MMPRVDHFHARVSSPVALTSIGKELTTDPADTDEDITAEMLSATDVSAYNDAAETLDALRAQIYAAGTSIIAREARVSRSVVKAFVNQGTVPHGQPSRRSRRRWSASAPKF